MAARDAVVVLFLWMFSTLASCLGASTTTTKTMPFAYRNQLREQCGGTRYPELCTDTLREQLAAHQSMQGLDVVSLIVNKTIADTNKLMLRVFASMAAGIVTDDRSCKALLVMSLKRLNQAMGALKRAPVIRADATAVQDIQTWLSAAITFQQTCKDQSPHSSSPVDSLSHQLSNALALVNRASQELPPPPTKRGGRFPHWVSPRTRRLLQAARPAVVANAVVAQDGTGQYKTVAEALTAASGGRFVIHVKAGVYREHIRCNKDGITLIGDGKYATVIVNGDSVAGGSSLYESATFSITGDGFIARDIGFHNTAGPEGGQALALNIASDHSVLFRCSIVGYQDTLFAAALRQFYRECDIQGTVDFIFGNAAAVFQNCNIILRRPRGSGTVILANGRTDPEQNTGFSLQNCRIVAGPELAREKHSYESYLGRPWKEYSRAVVMQSFIDDAVDPKGWEEWDGAGSGRLRTLYFGEFANSGPGSNTAGRVRWPGFHLLTPMEASGFTVERLIAGGSWLPSTGVTYVNGLR